MSKFTPAVAVMGALALGGGAAQAAVISVASPNLSSIGGSSAAPTIITAPTDVADGGASNTSMQAFDELQNVTLASPITVDGENEIPAGRVVNSHMIFLNSGDNGFISHSLVTWTFANRILGVMSDIGGQLIADSTNQLGVLSSTTYPGAFPNRGLEGPDDGSFTDGYTVSGNTITVSMGVNDPGDWIRVVTAAVPVPAAFPLLGGALALLGAVGLRRRNKS